MGVYQDETTLLLEQIVSANNCGIFAYTLPERRVLQVNREGLRMLGWEEDAYKPGDHIYRYMMDEMMDEDREKVSALAKQIQKPGDHLECTYRLCRGGEVYVKVQLSSKCLLMPGGGQMILSTLVDITEKSRIEEQLFESLQAFHIASRAAGNTVLTFDAKAQKARIERTVQGSYMEGEEITGVPYERVKDGSVPEESRAEYLRIHEEIMNGAKEAGGIVKRILPDGKRLVTRLNFQAVLDSEGRPTGKAIGVYADITESYLRETEQAGQLEAMQSRYDAIEKSAEKEARRHMDVIRALSIDYFAIYLVDLERNRIQVQRAQDKLLPQVAASIKKEASFDETIVDYVKNYVHPEEQERILQEMTLKNIRRRLQNEKVFFLRYRRVGAERTEYAEFKMVDVSDRQDGSRSVLAVRNVDAEVRRELEQQAILRDALTQTQYANKAKTIFLSNMSHDIRTPMNAIVGFASIAMEHMEDKNRVQDCVKKIMAASSHLQNLINDILDMSRIESGKMVLHESECELSEVVQSLLSVIQPQIQAKKLHFFMETVDLCHGSVYADALKLNQVLINILGNALKFTPQGGSIYFTVQEMASEKAGYAAYRFTVKDTGIGMSKEFQRHIFEPFERETTSTLSQTEGTGLGMTITKNIVDMMGGTIGIESAEGAGSTFTVELSLRVQESSSAEKRRVMVVNDDISRGKTVAERLSEVFETKEKDCKETLKRTRFEGIHLLVVEDNELNREIAEEILQEAGFVVDMAVNGIDAIEKLEASERHAYDLVLMDVQMPGMNGYEATKAIRRMKREDLAQLPIIAMTANAFEEDREQALKSGMNEHLAKPLNVEQMLQKISRWIRV